MSGSGLKKTILFILGFSIILLISLIIFIKSPSFLNLVENNISKRINRHVEIGSLSFENWSGIIVKGLIIKEGQINDIHISVPYLAVKFSIYDLFRMNIDEIIITKPELSITVQKEKAPEAEEEKRSIPFTFNRVSVSEARVFIQHEKNRSFQISPVNLSMEKDTNSGKTKLNVDAVINDLNSEISANAVIDMEKLTIERAHVDIPVIDLEILSGFPFLTFLKDIDMKGIAGLEIDIVPWNSGSTDQTVLNAVISMRDLSVRSEDLQINLKDRPINISLKGAYNRSNDRMDIVTLDVQISQKKLWTVNGTLEKVSSGNPDIDLLLRGNRIPLNEINKIATGSAIKWLDEIDIRGSVEAELSITGSLKSPKAKCLFNLSGERFKRGNILLESFETVLPLDYRDKTFFIKDASLVIKDISNIIHDKEETGIRINNFRLFIPNIEYRGSKIKSDTFQINADKAIISADKREYHTEKRMILQGVIEGNLEDHWIKFDSLSLNTDFIKKATGKVSVSMDRPIKIDAVLDYKNIDLEEFVHKLFNEFFQKRGFSVKGKGNAHAAFRITVPERDVPHLSGTTVVALKNGGFSSTDETIISEGIEMSISSSFKLPLSLDSIDFSVSSEATGFELLMGKFYGDFSDRVVYCLAKGRYTTVDDLLNIFQSKLGLTDTGNFFITGVVTGLKESPVLDADIKLTNLSGKETFDFFIRETFQEQFPFLSHIGINGRGSLNLNVKGSFDRFDAQGNLSIDDMHIRDNNTDNSLTGISISLPFDISFPKAVPERTIKRFGSLRVKNITWTPFQLRDFEAFPCDSE